MLCSGRVGLAWQRERGRERAGGALGDGGGFLKRNNIALMNSLSFKAWVLNRVTRS